MKVKEKKILEKKILESLESMGEVEDTEIWNKMTKEKNKELLEGEVLTVLQIKRCEIMSSEELLKYVNKGYNLITIASLINENHKYLYVFITKHWGRNMCEGYYERKEREV